MLSAFAIVAIFGALPVGLNASHSSQDDTRAGQIAQDILTSLASQAQATYPAALSNNRLRQTAADFTYNMESRRNDYDLHFCSR